MALIGDFLGESSSTITPAMSIPDRGVMKPGSNYIALFLVDRNTLPDTGSSYTPAGGGTSTTLTVLNIISALKLLAQNGKATFFGDRTINGTKKDPKEFESIDRFGTEIENMPTGEVSEEIAFAFKHMFLNIEWANILRFNQKAYDAYVFTPGSVTIVRFDKNAPIFKKIGHNIDGDIMKEIKGAFSMFYKSIGEIAPLFGTLASDLAADSVNYTFAAPATVTGIAAVGGSSNPVKFTVTGAIAGSFVAPITDAAGLGVVIYQIFKDVKTPVPTAEPVSVNSATGAVTVGAGLLTGTFNYTVVAVGPTGVRGKYAFQIVKS